jgi:preprotein translocase subunit YajC
VNIPSFVHVLFAQAGDAKPASPADMLSPIIIVIPIIALFYFMIIRPQKKEQAKRQEMIDGIKKNDTVITIGGMSGVVMKADKAADEVVLRVDDAAGTKIRFTFGAIAKVITPDGGESSNASTGN